jgi:hypothetical protein
MARLVGFFLCTFVALQLLRLVPFVGGLFRVPLVGFFLASIVVSLIVSRYASAALDSKQLRRRMRDLGNVDTPHNQGKLGSLTLVAGNAKGAIGPLEKAVAGEPESLEWRWRLGLALLATGRAAEAATTLAVAYQTDEDYAYGELAERYAEAQLASRDAKSALATLEHVERHRGGSPRSAYLLGRTCRALGEKQRARQSFALVGERVSKLGRLKPKGSDWLALQAFIQRWV